MKQFITGLLTKEKTSDIVLMYIISLTIAGVVLSVILTFERAISHYN